MENYIKDEKLAVDLNTEKSYVLKNSHSLDPLMERIGDAHCVLLGEASHGTHEYYTWRTAISKRLIEEKGFNFIAVEGDWPDCYKLNRYIKGYVQDKSPVELLNTFRRWPTWMWANWEIAALIAWLKNRNDGLYPAQKAGFYGLDVYSLWESMDTIVAYLKKVDPHTAAIAKKAAQCFEPFEKDEFRYARQDYKLSDSCRAPLTQLLTEILKNSHSYDHDLEAALNAEQNAHVLINAEEYYRNMIGFNENSWNLRDTHMMETLQRLFKFHGPESKGIVWEHNSHIGDARYTSMYEEGLINVGQLIREERGTEDVVLVGFSTYQGSVIAGEEWEAPMQVMEVPPARVGSVEDLLHKESEEDRLLIFDKTEKQRFDLIMPHRAIGVVYHPEHESRRNYQLSVLSSRYDAFIYLDQTTELHPLHLKPDEYQIPETYPFNF